MSLFTPMRTFTRDVLTVLSGKNLLEEKVNPAYQGMILYGDMPQPHMLPRAYKNYSQEGYRTDPTTYKCISYIARNGAAIPPKLYTDRTREKEIESHALLDLLNKPNTEQTSVAYRESILGYLLIAGNSYQYAIRPQKNGAPAELWTLRPDYVQIVANASRGITGYQYKPQNNPTAAMEYEAVDVAHTKYWAPDDELYGLSPMEIAALLIDQQTSARKWNLALLQNWARLPGAWVTPEPIGKNERERLEAKLKERFHGYKNAGAPPVLDAGLTWQTMGIEPAKMDWLEGLQFNAAAIANIYNIPPMIIGDTSATTFDNMKQAEIYSYTEGIFPDLDKVYDGWNNWLVPMYPDLKKMGAYLYYDKESVEVIQEMIQAKKDAQIARATTVWMSGGCDMYTYQELCGLPPDPNGRGVYRLQNALVLSDQLVEYAKQALALVPVLDNPFTARQERLLDGSETTTPSEVPTPRPNAQVRGNTPSGSQELTTPSGRQLPRRRNQTPATGREALQSLQAEKTQEESQEPGNFLIEIEKKRKRRGDEYREWLEATTR